MKKQMLLLLVLCIAMLLPSTYAFSQEAVTWTEEELEFIKAHPVIKVGVDPKFVPFEFIDTDNEYKGIAADYIAEISKLTGIQFEIQKGLDWPEAYSKALSGDIDVLPAISKTSEREQYFLFSQPYYYFKRVIVTRDSDSEISGLEDLEGLTVAVQKNSSHHSYLLSKPNINLSLYDSVEGALTAVANFTERAFVGNLATTNYLIKTNALTNLKFIAFEAEKEQALHFAVRRDWPQLVAIINKAMITITTEEKLAITDKWIDVESTNDLGPLLRTIAMIAGLAAAILGVSVFWITRLKKEIAERQRIQIDLENAKVVAEEANQFKSSFMARMSHEIRTPLNAITGMAYLMKKTDISPTQSTYLDRIAQASTNMLSIINDILDFSKIEAGKIELEITSFSMDQVIQEVVNIVSYKIEEQGIGFRLSKDPSIPNWFHGDPKRIEQVLLNVLNNAAKFTNKGEVSLDVRLVAKEGDKYHMTFSIKDTGIGMSEDQVKKLFTPFTQADSSINRRYGGSGLGLSIVKNLLDMMEGTIQVFSTEGEGTTFMIHLTLPVDREREQEYIDKISSTHFQGVRTLVLEKTGANMNLIEKYLSAFGMHCELTSSQASAKSMLEAADGKFAKPFDLFILDYDTPTEGGFEFLKEIKSSNRIAKQPKIIMLIPMMREDLFDRLNENGVDIGIGKPIIPSVLFNGILEVFKLKAVSASQPKENKEEAEKVYGDNIKVLIVEDNKTNQLIARSLLKQAGIQSIVASDGKEGVKMYIDKNDTIKLILMDLHMPVMNGYEASEAIRKISSSIPIVAMTADVILGVKDKCEEAGIDHYISKPFDPDRFIKTVRDILSEVVDDPGHEETELDTEAGIRNMGGDPELYLEVLKEYFKENSDTLEKLDSAIKSKDYKGAAQIIHKIKGSSGSVGATSVHSVSREFQEALQNLDARRISILYKEFLNKFTALMSQAGDYLIKMGNS